tara:strand:+ start:3701 stop:3910 length:210 start_codon:yes stop_codon:yes gene_type:complete
MNKKINYDFTVESLITVEAPVGTDPATLESEALAKLAAQTYHHQIVLDFHTTFDAETGKYSDDWENTDE